MGRRRSVRRKRWAIRAALAVVLLIASINGLVMALGKGSPHLLSPRFLSEKAQALALLGLHYVRHPWADCDASSRAALQRAGRRHGVSASFLIAIAKVESDLRAHRISHAGAMGMMQLMPGTARQLGVWDPFDKAESADGAARWVKRLWRRYGGNRSRVAAAYNAGPGAVPRTGPLRLVGETKVYVRRVMAELNSRRGRATARR